MVDDETIYLGSKDRPGDIINLHGLKICLPKKPTRSEILFHDQPKNLQMWRRIPMPEEMQRIKSMDEWLEKPKEFRDRFSPYIEREFDRRRNGVWFYNNGVPTYITGRHYMFLQWSKIDIGYPSYLSFQREIFLHLAACEVDPNCIG